MSIATDSTSTAVGQSTKKRTPWSGIWATVGIGFIVIYCLAPFYWMVVSSLRPDTEIFENTWWPRHTSFENYQAVFSAKNNFGQGLINSLVVSIVVTIVALAVATFASYALARLDFRGKGFLLLVVLATSMFPPGGHHRAAAEELLRLAVDQHLPGDDRPRPVLLAAAGGVESDQLLQADAPGAGTVRDG